MRLIHTAELRLDACFKDAGLPPAVGNRLRQGAREVLHRIVLRAGDWPADALLIAGNLFDQERVTRDTIGFLISEFQAIAHVPVFIAPGKSDPYCSGSPYATENWPRNVTIFRTTNWTRVPVRGGRLVVHGLGYTGDGIPRGPFRSMELEGIDESGAHVALAYGWEKQPGRRAEADVFDAIAYAALGTARSATERQEDAHEKVGYAGAPHPLGFDEKDHAFIEVEVLAGEARIRRVPSARVSLVALDIDCAGMTTVDEVAQAARSRLASEALPVVLRLTLSGPCPRAIRGNLNALHDALAGEMQYVQVIDRTTSDTDYAALAEEDTSVGAFVRTINEELDDCTDEARRRLLYRARETGIAAFTREPCEIKGLETV